MTGFPQFDVCFRRREPGQIRFIKVTIEASSAEVAGDDARRTLDLPAALYDIVYIHGRECLLSERETLAVKAVANALAEREREDIIGGMMKWGIFRILNDDELVALARKLELTPDERKRWDPPKGRE